MTQEETVLHIETIVKRYGGVTALDGVSLDVAPGEFFGLLGPNGAGKSTLMSLVAGLQTADGGVITLDGAAVGVRQVAARRRIGFVPQEIALHAELSAEQNLRIFGGIYGLRGAELRTRIDEALQAVQLGERRRDQVRALSGGMQRRLNLAAALLHRPSLLLCDEPTVGVDAQSRLALFEHLERLNRDGVTILYSTHYMEEAVRLCSRIGIMDQGKMLALGTIEELLTQLPFEDEIAFPATATTSALAAALAGHGSLSSDASMHRFGPAPGFGLSHFYTLAEQHNLSSRKVAHGRPTLEALFFHLTGRKLRE